MLLLVLLACSDAFEGGEKSPEHTGEVDSAEETEDTSLPDDTGEPVDTGPKDRDGDGYDETVDCRDTDASIYPGAPEIWYDGEDSDCAGDSDYDQDHDGTDAEEVGGDDCLDTDPATYPGAAEVWYDGVDGDCAGGNDFDQDGDGDPIPAGGGSDCDDLDATANAYAMETLLDSVDGDCDGDVNRFWLSALDTTGASGLQGPRFAADSTTAMVSFLADSFTDPVDGSTAEAGSFTYSYDEADPWSGMTGTTTWKWGSGYMLNEGFDFVADDDAYTWGYGMETGGVRWLLADVYDLASGDFFGTGYTYPTSQPFQDVELTVAPDASLHLVGCDARLGFLTWMHGSADDFFTNSSDLVGDDLTGVEADVCVVDMVDRVAMAADSASTGVETFTYNDRTGLAASSSTLAGYAVYDIQAVYAAGVSVRLVAAGTAGVQVTVDAEQIWLTTREARTVRGMVLASGNVALVYTDGTEAVLAWGRPSGGFTEIVLDTGLGRADDADVFASSSGQAIVAVRGGDRAVLGVVGVP